VSIDLNRLASSTAWKFFEVAKATVFSGRDLGKGSSFVNVFDKGIGVKVP